MSYFTRNFEMHPRLRCRICGRPGDSRESMLFEEAHPTVAFHETCLQQAAGDEIDAMAALLEVQKMLLRSAGHTNEHRLNIHELAALIDRVDEMRDAYSERLDQLKASAKEAFAAQFGR